jgi:predicted dehydrogenase
VRIGLIGCGEAGSLRAMAIARLAGFRLVAVADIDTSRAQAMAAQYGAAVESDWRTLVQREEVDAVLVSSPPPFHPAMCVEALQRGKHVLCEKPLARTPAECREVLAAAAQNNRVLATGFNYRFYPAVMKAREILDAGVIGKLDHIRSYAGHPGGKEFTHPWVHDANVMGGGTLLDNGIHLIDLTRYFLGEVEKVQGVATGRIWHFPNCEDNGFALLQSPTGQVASLQASWSEWRGYRFYIEIYGTRGCVRALYPPMLTQVVRMQEPGGRLRRKFYLFPRLQVIERLRSYRWTGLQSFMRELAAFARTIHGEHTPLALGRDGLRSVQIAYAVYRSSTEGGVVCLED